MTKTTNKTFSTYSAIYNKHMVEAKNYIEKNFGNVYLIRPHITYNIAPIPDYNIESVFGAVKNFVLNIKPFKITLDSLGYQKNKHFYYINVKSDNYFHLHKQLTSLINKYRDGYLREKDVQRLEAGVYDDKSAKNIKNYGFARVFDNYINHITLGELKNTDNFDPIKTKRELSKILKPLEKETILVSEIAAVYYQDDLNQSDIINLKEVVYDL